MRRGGRRNDRSAAAECSSPTPRAGGGALASVDALNIGDGLRSGQVIPPDRVPRLGHRMPHVRIPHTSRFVRCMSITASTRSSAGGASVPFDPAAQGLRVDVSMHRSSGGQDSIADSPGCCSRRSWYILAAPVAGRLVALAGHRSAISLGDRSLHQSKETSPGPAGDPEPSNTSTPPEQPLSSRGNVPPVYLRGQSTTGHWRAFLMSQRGQCARQVPGARMFGSRRVVRAEFGRRMCPRTEQPWRRLLLLIAAGKTSSEVGGTPPSATWRMRIARMASAQRISSGWRSPPCWSAGRWTAWTS